MSALYVFKHAGLRICALLLCALCVSALNFSAFVTPQQTEKPDWCKPLPRTEFKNWVRVPIADPWFEVYIISAGVYAIYEPHQSEETISYLIVGHDKAILFDTGMGIRDIKQVVNYVTRVPVIVLNSHTHEDHVGGNWQFDTVLGMDVIVCTSARTDEEARELLKAFNFPFRIETPKAEAPKAAAA